MTEQPIHSAAIGLAGKNSQAEIIEVFYPHPELGPDRAAVELACQAAGLSPAENGYAELPADKLDSLAAELEKAGAATWSRCLRELTGSKQSVLLCLLRTDQAPASIPEAYLKLQLLSHRLCRPHDINLDGLFGVLKNLAWTNEGAIDLQDLPARQLQARKQGRVLDVMSVDKFPKMTSYVVPSGVRIADTARVRLGAYIGEGTTVMHEGFVNFNAGTLGTAMVEGRISAGVVVGEDSDLGGGCSTMGTLSGGGTTIISVGRNCLIGANAGIGFPLPDGCIVEAGLYVTGGTKVNVLDESGNKTATSKASELANTPNLLYRRNSLSGAVEAVPIRNSVTLNEELHSHN
jgi:2,3,4,5-tetrahydropyridine-2-carboxylate N-succinyltransferase